MKKNIKNLLVFVCICTVITLLLAFTNALKSAPNNLVEGKHYAVNGLDVFITWQ